MTISSPERRHGCNVKDWKSSSRCTHTQCFDPSLCILSEVLQKIYGFSLYCAPHHSFPQHSCRAVTCDTKVLDLMPGMDQDVPQVKTYVRESLVIASAHSGHTHVHVNVQYVQGFDQNRILEPALSFTIAADRSHISVQIYH